MIERDEESKYTVQPDEAVVVIRPDGEVEVLMPESDEDSDGMLSTGSPSFKAMVIMAFIRDTEVRKQVTEKLVAEHFSGGQ